MMFFFIAILTPLGIFHLMALYSEKEEHRELEELPCISFCGGKRADTPVRCAAFCKRKDNESKSTGHDL